MPLATAIPDKDSQYRTQVKQYLDLRRQLQDYRMNLPAGDNGSQTDPYVQSQMPMLENIKAKTIADIGPARWQQLVQELTRGK